MKDPYEVLGVSPSATDEEVKAAYRALAKKYHPDNYVDNPLADLAQEKMQEINDAYDAITKQRKGGGSSYGGGYAGGSSYTGGYAGGSRYADIRSLIRQNRILDAEQLLDGVPSDQRDAEWYYLKGHTAYKRGRLDDAYTYFSRARQMDPSNMEYRSAFEQVSRARATGGYRPVDTESDCGGCDLCSSLICANCLCNMCCR